MEGTRGPYIKWLNYGYEGWKPYSYPDIKSALTDNNSYGNEFVITKLSIYEIKETSND